MGAGGERERASNVRPFAHPYPPKPRLRIFVRPVSSPEMLSFIPKKHEVVYSPLPRLYRDSQEHESGYICDQRQYVIRLFFLSQERTKFVLYRATAFALFSEARKTFTVLQTQPKYQTRFQGFESSVSINQPIDQSNGRSPVLPEGVFGVL